MDSDECWSTVPHVYMVNYLVEILGIIDAWPYINTASLIFCNLWVVLFREYSDNG